MEVGCLPDATSSIAGARPGAFGRAVIHALDPTHLWDAERPIVCSMLWRFCASTAQGLTGIFNAHRPAIAAVPLIKAAGGHLWAFMAQPWFG